MKISEKMEIPVVVGCHYCSVRWHDYCTLEAFLKIKFFKLLFVTVLFCGIECLCFAGKVSLGKMMLSNIFIILILGKMEGGVSKVVRMFQEPDRMAQATWQVPSTRLSVGR